MQTFLPYESFKHSAKCLDYKRLGKQRVEAFQLIKSHILGDKYSWSKHPASKMWLGYTGSLVEYSIKITTEWIKRGYNDTMLERFLILQERFPDTSKPKFLGKRKFHNSHKSNLLRKDFEFYSKYNWNIPTNLNYVWY